MKNNDLVTMHDLIVFDETTTLIQESIDAIDLSKLKLILGVWNRESETALLSARGTSIKNNESFTVVGERLTANKEKLKQMEAIHKTYRDPANNYLEKVLNLFNVSKTGYKMAIDIESKAITAYTELVRKENERLQKEAEAKAQAEAKKLEEKAAKAKTPEKQAELLEQSQMKSATVVTDGIPLPKIAGLTQKGEWYADKIDVNLLPKEWMIPNEELINQMGAKTEGKMIIPGVVFKYRQKTIGARK